jgi:hypothetical protein
VQIARSISEPFIGLLKEDPGLIIGHTARSIFLEQFNGVFFGTHGSWWKDDLQALGGFAEEVENTSLGKVIRANTGARVDDDVFRV